MYFLIGLGLGLILGWFQDPGPRLLRVNAGLIRYSLVFLLVVMGMRIGSNEEILRQLGSLGFQSLVLAGAGIIGSVVAVQAVRRYLKSGDSGP